MAYVYNGIDRSAAMNRTWAFPLDERSYFNSIECAEEAALTAQEAGSVETEYYFGQTVSVYDSETNKVNAYIIDVNETIVEEEVDGETVTKTVLTGKLSPMGGIDISEGIVIGEDACAGGRSTNISIGTCACASGTDSTAIGTCATASGDNSTALGNLACASGWYSTALGYEACAMEMYSTALGPLSYASGIYSTALGYKASATCHYSTALGYCSCASGFTSTALGSYAKTSGTSSVAIGSFSCAYDGSINIMTTKDTWYVECATTRGNEILLYSENTCQYVDGNTSTACACYGCVSYLKVDREGVLTVNDEVIKPTAEIEASVVGAKYLSTKISFNNSEKSYSSLCAYISDGNFVSRSASYVPESETLYIASSGANRSPGSEKEPFGEAEERYGVWKSTDMGCTWEKTSAISSDTDAHTVLAFNHNGEDVIFSASSGPVQNGTTSTATGIYVYCGGCSCHVVKQTCSCGAEIPPIGTRGSWAMIKVDKEVNGEVKPVVYAAVNKICGYSIIYTEDIGNEWKAGKMFDNDGVELKSTMTDNGDGTYTFTTKTPTMNSMYFDEETGIYYAGCENNETNNHSSLFKSTDGINWYSVPGVLGATYGITKINGRIVLANGQEHASGDTEYAGAYYIDEKGNVQRGSISVPGYSVSKVHFEKYEMDVAFLVTLSPIGLYYSVNGRDWETFVYDFTEMPGDNKGLYGVQAIPEKGTVVGLPWASQAMFAKYEFLDIASVSTDVSNVKNTVIATVGEMVKGLGGINTTDGEYTIKDIAEKLNALLVALGETL